MARITIDMPENYSFSTDLNIRMADTNGNHMSNYAVLTLMTEARLHFLAHHGYNEDNIMVTDSAIIYKAEGHYGDMLEFNMAASDFNKYGCDIFYLIKNKKTGADVAHAKTGLIFYDYDNEKVAHLPEGFRQHFEQSIQANLS